MATTATNLIETKLKKKIGSKYNKWGEITFRFKKINKLSEFNFVIFVIFFCTDEIKWNTIYGVCKSWNQ